MDKLRFVIDTNVLVSSILIASSPPDIALKKDRYDCHKYPIPQPFY